MYGKYTCMTPSCGKPVARMTSPVRVRPLPVPVAERPRYGTRAGGPGTGSAPDPMWQGLSRA